MRWSGESKVRLTLLVALASSQLSLLVRADQVGFAIMSALAWMGGGLLLLEREEGGQAVPLSQVPRRRFLLSAALLFWALLVLSFSARLYDPLLLVLPLVVLPALGSLAGMAWFSSALGTQILIGLLPVVQVIINRYLPTAGLARSTAQLSAFLLWLLGTPAISEGPNIIVPGRVLRVDASCTGVTVLALCLAASLMLALVLPPPPLAGRSRRGSLTLVLATLGTVALITAFLVNALRVTLLAFTDFTPGLTGFSRIRSFGFWHEGIGSHLFSFVAITIVCTVYVVFLELTCSAPAPRIPHEP